MKYLKYFENNSAGYDVLYQLATTGSGLNSTMVKFNSLISAIDFSKKIINEETDYLIIYKVNYYKNRSKYMEKWWGECEYFEKAVKQPEYFEDYLFGLEGAYKDIISKLPNAFIFLNSLRENKPNIYNKLINIYPEIINLGADMGDLGFK